MLVSLVNLIEMAVAVSMGLARSNFESDDRALNTLMHHNASYATRRKLK
jgi:hypothetical protein